MPQTCPHCNRPNGDFATRCLYCAEPLTPPAVAEESTDDGTEGWPESTTVVVTTFDDAARAAQVTSFPLAWFEAGPPLALETFPDSESARSLHAYLLEQGLGASVVADAELGRMGTTFVARGVQAEGGSLVFANAAGAELRLAAESVDIMVQYRFRGTEEEAFHSRSLLGRNIPLIAGGTESTQLLDLYAADQRPVRIVAEDFDYSLLGPARAPTVSDNFPLLLEILSEICPHARHDLGFGQVGPNIPVRGRRRFEVYGRRLARALAQD